MPGSGGFDELAAQALDHAPAGLLVIDADGRIVRANHEAARIFGYDRDDLIGRSVEDLVPDRSRSGHAALRADYLADPVARPLGAGRELFGMRRNGSEFPVEVGLRPVRALEGLHVLASVVDVTERRRAEQELRASEERFRVLVQGVRDHALMMLDPEGRIESWNDAARRITGYTQAEVLGRPHDLLLPPGDRTSRGAGALEEATRQGRHESEGWYVRADGSRFLASCSLFPLQAAGERLRGFVQVLRDVTTLRVLEDQVRQSQRLEAIGAMAGGLAHDFNNILLAVHGYAELARDRVSDERVHRDLDQVLRAADRGRRVIERLLVFSRKEAAPSRVVALATPVSQALDLLRASLPKTVDLRFRADPDAPDVACDETQVNQVLMNLVTNAAHAIGPDGGVVDVSVTPFRLEGDAARRAPGLRAGLHARLRVCDTGHGMEPDVLAAAFQPFFTTKAPGEGTGLGLWMTREIVQAHDGVIDIRSRVGEGTTVDVYFPARIVREAEQPPEAAQEEREARAPHVLYVEDEAVLAELARRQLERAGYRVTTFTSSLQALEDFRADPARYDLVVTDNSMPHLTGTKLAEELHGIRPEVRILMVSGHAGGGPDRAELPTGVRRILRKPHGSAELLEAVSAVLASD